MAGSTPTAVAEARRYVGADIPSGLARWQAVLTAAIIVWALVTTALLANTALKNSRGADNTWQLTRINAIKTNLFTADALATNAFLVGGLEPAEQREQYDAALSQVSRIIVESAEAQSADVLALAELNDEVLRYAEQMQQARANNRQGLPVGAQYLREASEEMRGHTVDVLDALVEANQSRALGSFTGGWALLIGVPGLLLLLLLGWFNQQLAQLFRRRFNVGLMAAAGIIGVLTIAAVVLTWSLSNSAANLKDGLFKTATSVAAARTAANDAKSNESLRLIARGSGASYEEAWESAAASVEENLGQISTATERRRAWRDYAQAHEEIVAADESGDWDGAVALATSTDPDSAASKFEAFDTQAGDQVGMASKSVASSFTGNTIWAVVAAVGTLLGAIAAVAVSVSCTSGISVGAYPQPVTSSAALVSMTRRMRARLM